MEENGWKQNDGKWAMWEC